MSERTKWEYKVHYIPYLRLEEVLREMGAEGWELVSMISGESVELILVFKRPKDEESVEEEQLEGESAKLDSLMFESWEEIVASTPEDEPQASPSDAEE